jgi:hypothetical protein
MLPSVEGGHDELLDNLPLDPPEAQMSIAPIQIPTWQQGRDLDFTQLAQLPQVWRKAQQDAWTLANIDSLRAAQELTPAIREYNLARRQGFQGSFIDFARARRLAHVSE